MNRSFLLAATALSAVVASGTASAQSSSSPSANESQTGQPTGAASTTSPQAAVNENTAINGNPETTPGAGNDVIVTGSRIRGSKVDTAVTVTAISAAELLGTRGDVSVGDALNQLPQLRSTFSQANSTGSIGTSGLNLLDLRGLGTSRTLTLVNGRRIVTAVPGSYTPDINTIPSELIERVDIVTGGNSAIYGSDAVAGVVNFVLRRDFEGVRLRAQGGATTYGDRGSYRVSGIVGHNFGDKLNVVLTGEYTRAQPLFYSDRDYLGAISGTPGSSTHRSPRRRTATSTGFRTRSSSMATRA